MAEGSSRHKVVHAPGQGWLVDEFVQRGEVPVTAERLEVDFCPRGRLYLIDTSVLEQPTLEPAITFREPDLVEEFRERFRREALQDLINQMPVTDPRSVLQIVSPP